MTRRRFSLTHFTSTERAVLLALRGSTRGKRMSCGAIVSIVWPDPDKEPDFPEQCVKVHFHRIRKKLAGTDVEIFAGLGRGGGYYLGGPAAGMP